MNAIFFIDAQNKTMNICICKWEKNINFHSIFLKLRKAENCFLVFQLFKNKTQDNRKENQTF